MDPDSEIAQSPGRARFPSDIRGLSISELEQLAAAAGQPRFRAVQLAQWLYQKHAGSFDQMTNLPIAFRQYLMQHFNLAACDAATVTRSSDGTRKLLLRLRDGKLIESVIIPSEGRTTLCLSSQAGCAMNCSFCATATMGLERNLSAAEIVSQIIMAGRYLDSGEALTNFVFMGMGEPLANYVRLRQALTIITAPWGMGISPRRVTVSTVGLVPMMEKLMAETQVKLAVSLAASSDQVRDRLMPINLRYPLQELLAACARLDLGRRRITFEYVMLKGVNDAPADASRLVKLLSPIRAKVNLIFFNPFEGTAYQPSPRATVQAFQAILLKGNLTATIRESRGPDIAAACGQLRAKYQPAPAV